MTDQRDVAKVELIEHGREVGGQGIEITAVGRLVGTGMPPPVIGDERRPYVASQSVCSVQIAIPAPSRG